MEFWGVEVKPGESVKCSPGELTYLHISQAALGDIKKDSGHENIPLFLKFNNQKHVIGTLSGEKCAQLPFDLCLEKEFELSHSSKDTSVYFCGYKSVQMNDESSDFDDSDSDEENLQLQAKENGKPEIKAEPAKVTIGKADALTPKPKTETEEASKVEKQNVGADDNDEDDDEDDEDYDVDGSDDDDEDMVEAESNSEDEDGNGSTDEDEETPQKVESGMKRKNEAAAKTPAPEKKAKLVSPARQKTGDGKKGGHTATPHPAKRAGKTPANNGKSKQQTPKSAGSLTCKPCNKSFNSENALQAHSKAKHGAK